MKVELTERQNKLIIYSLKMYGMAMFRLGEEFDIYDIKKSTEARHVVSECSRLVNKLTLLTKENKL